VVAAFSVWPVTVFYVVAMVALYFHLDHGIWSLLQTLGFSTVRNAAALKRLSKVVAILVFLGFISVPVAVMTGWVS
jgi:succinate dehydrogenase / fumarate reductase cytochrome b subunit